jgi:hypothetical protein
MDTDFEEELERVAVVTVDMNHEQVDRSVREVLKLMREHLAMNATLVSHFMEVPPGVPPGRRGRQPMAWCRGQLRCPGPKGCTPS